MKGRRTPPREPLPPFAQVGGANPDLDTMLAALAGQSGLFVLNVAHDSWCKTLKTGRGQDCNCDPDHRLLKFRDGGLSR